MRGRLAITGLFAAAVAVVASGGPVGAQLPRCGDGPGNGKPFPYLEDAQTFRVPERVTQLKVLVEGGHGGQYNRTAWGGPGGGVEALIEVKPGECLRVYTGDYGHHLGGHGFDHGGAHGTNDGAGLGHSAAGGGGSSAILRRGRALVVAGGGGGGGGDGNADKTHGGDGGAGGLVPQDGNPGAGPNVGEGGKGGGSRGRNGDGGSDSSAGSGAGGGGGAGVNGGRGGDAGDELIDSGGGGGGGGRSYAGPGTADVHHYVVDAAQCAYRTAENSPLCKGHVTLCWGQLSDRCSPPAYVHDVRREQIASRGVPVSIRPGDETVTLRLYRRSEAKLRPLVTRTVKADADRRTEVSLPLSRFERRRIRRAEKHVRLHLRVHHGKRRVQTHSLTVH